MQGNPVGWFEIYVDDIERAKAFYQTVFAVDLERLGDPKDSNMEMWSFGSDMEQYGATGATGALVKMAGCSAGGNSTMVYFNCEDCLIEQARVEEAGGKIQQEKMSIGEYGFIAMIVDTEGNMFGLHSTK